MMQDYGNPPSRNAIKTARANLKSGADIGGGGNQTQGAGEIPGKVPVPVSGTNATQTPYKGGVKQVPAGFNNALINGKV